MDYKATLLLPDTPFPMRGNLPQKEPERYTRWDSQNVYAKMLKNRENAASEFTLHDGPPYANGHIHIGHALNKILKDIIFKYHYFQGAKSTYVPGWDCHGLPIEQQVEKKLGKAKKDALPKQKIRELCREHAAKFIDVQREEFKQLGVLGQWDKPYQTMDFRFEADIYRSLCEIAKKGLLVERSKPVYWSWACTTALAEAEVEYEEKESDSIFVAFDLSDSAKAKLDISGDAAIVIWTTTPWTLPANTGIALHPKEEYVLTGDGYIVAKKLHESLSESGVVSSDITKTFNAPELENEKAVNPLNLNESHIVMGEHVEMTGGSGAVHTAPGHGEDDYRVGLLYKLPVIMPVDDNGKFDSTVVREKLLPDAENFNGKHVFEANDAILKLLKNKLLKATKIKHSYPHCWRSHTPIIFRATRQWFIALDQEIEAAGKTLREIALDEINKVDFYPAHGINRLASMIENRPDWCISRQREWGVPIAFFRNRDSGEVIFDADLLEHLGNVFEKEGCDAWWSKTTAELLPEGSPYHPDRLEKVMDILDVWFDSGSTWNAVLKNEEFQAGSYPASMYLEGSDQHRGWFQSSLLVSCAVNHHAPYGSVLTHGFTMDEKGEKMSKSKGNVVAPSDVLKQYGGEILRLWVALSDYTGDLKISTNILKQFSEQYRKIRNTLRFLLANISDLESLTPVENLGILDKWILKEAKTVLDEVNGYFKVYDFAKGFSALNQFIVNDLSGIYMDLCKDRLYCDSKDDPHRRASQSTMAMIAKSLLGLIAPVLTHTVDEILENAPAMIKGDNTDVFDLVYEPLPTVESGLDAAYLKKAREKFNELVDGLKKDKVIKSALELDLYTDSEMMLNLPRIEAEDWFIISHLSSKEHENPILTFTVENDHYVIYKSHMHKCPRCWKYKSRDEDTLCGRCDSVLNK